MATTVLIVDDHPTFRAVARRLLEADGYEVIGEAVDGGSGIEAVERLQPDVVLLDVHLPDTDGFAVAERIGRGNGGPRIVLTSSRDADEFPGLVAASPAAGFVSKGDLSGAALAAILE